MQLVRRVCEELHRKKNQLAIAERSQLASAFDHCSAINRRPQAVSAGDLRPVTRQKEQRKDTDTDTKEN